MEPLSIRDSEYWTESTCPYFFFAGIEIPKFQDKVTPEYKPKFDQLVWANSAILIVIVIF
jgi:hypothetical protein